MCALWRSTVAGPRRTLHAAPKNHSGTCLARSTCSNAAVSYAAGSCMLAIDIVPRGLGEQWSTCALAQAVAMCARVENVRT